MAGVAGHGGRRAGGGWGPQGSQVVSTRGAGDGVGDFKGLAVSVRGVLRV